MRWPVAAYLAALLLLVLVFATGCEPLIVSDAPTPRVSAPSVSPGGCVLAPMSDVCMTGGAS